MGRPDMTLRLSELPYATDRGYGSRARIGLLAMSSDTTIEHDFRTVLAQIPDVELYTARITGKTADPHKAALEQAEEIVHSSHLLLPNEHLDLIALAAGTTVIQAGEDTIETRLKNRRPDVPVTTPILAIRSALRTCGVGLVGVLSPYGTELNMQIEQALGHMGIKVAVIGSFDENRDTIIGSITEAAIRHNVLALAETSRMDGFLVAGIQLRSLSVVGGLERELGIPVIGTSHALIWNSLRRAGIKDSVRGYGLLYNLPK